MGVEYIVSDKLFKNLPETEKALWHSHVHEVKSGQLIAPGIPEVAEHELMKKLIGTYGKTWHTWHTDLQKALPLGVPQLMMGFTADGQGDIPRMVPRATSASASQRGEAEDRADIPRPHRPGCRRLAAGAGIPVRRPAPQRASVAARRRARAAAAAARRRAPLGTASAEVARFALVRRPQSSSAKTRRGDGPRDSPRGHRLAREVRAPVAMRTALNMSPALHYRPRPSQRQR